MNVVLHDDAAVARIAGAIGDRARARILYSLADGHARTSTELAVVAEVSASTASAHLNRLKAERLIKVHAQGKHRYYSLEGPNVASVLEGLSVLAGGRVTNRFVPNTPSQLRTARTCYDHIAGTLGVLLHDCFQARGWFSADRAKNDNSYKLTAEGAKAFQALGINLTDVGSLRRHFALACLDWSERRPHLGGALGAALLNLALKKRWVTQELDSRALVVTRTGRREFMARFALQL
ncbi:MAG TPA: winged helix-turn-helix domain-containing protein [Candidatus Sulfotelmatobacter sp.]|nr:winged helix-turn-helix domain-containing protein [Candidatus Sulfotelmatobacter sp.]